MIENQDHLDAECTRLVVVGQELLRWGMRIPISRAWEEVVRMVIYGGGGGGHISGPPPVLCYVSILVCL
ncbi:hypothetical protein KSP40_PGU001762 [Platanthera guangdongensis]|uniref:Uncharacterized protein n=1 Tax=Platanthera guangdongensis TaxID=2320717 RepID=A0ABR2M1T8_9ASPA